MSGGIEVFVADEQDAHAIDTDRWLRFAVQVLSAEGVDRNTQGVEMSLLFVDEPAIAALNEQFMGKSGPTDVLSFPIDEEASPRHIPPLAIAAPIGAPPPMPPSSDDEDDDDFPMLLGDVVICPSVAAANASAHASELHDGTIDDEIGLLVVHGILHLLGMDHMEETEAQAMEAREQELLTQFHRQTKRVV
jgi:probable rRNA maturation factor